MGVYTDFLKLYKPDGPEMVDAPTQLNRNLDIIDGRFKVVFDYFGTDVKDILASSLDKSLYAKYYQTLNNGVAYIDTFSTPPQATIGPDLRAAIPTFLDFNFLNGWNAVPSFTSPTGYFLEKNELEVATKVRLTGNIRLNAADQIVPGTFYTVGNVPFPPSVVRYFMANTDTNTSSAQVSININGNLAVTRFGSAESDGLASNLVSLSGIEWAL